MSTEFKLCFSEDSIKLSWKRVLASAGYDVRDYFGYDQFKDDLETNIITLSSSLKENTYKPSRPFKYYEPKKSGTQRTITVLNIEDSIVYQAIANYIAQITFDDYKFAEKFIFGSVLSPSVKYGTEILKNDEEEVDFHFYKYFAPLYNEFLTSVNSQLKKDKDVFRLETDITAFFDTILHSQLILNLHKRGIDSDILILLSECLNIWSGTRESTTQGAGIPQGPTASSFFANLVLNEIDELIISDGLMYYRFMDDIRIYHKDYSKLVSTLVKIDKVLKSKALSINSDKTEIKKVLDIDEELNRLLNSSGIDVKMEGDKHVLAEIELIEQDTSQTMRNVDTQFDKDTIPNNEAIKIYYSLLEDIINKLENIKIEGENQKSSQLYFKNNSKIVRRVLSLTYTWRKLSVLLDAIDLHSISDNTELWLFYISNIPWKTNNFIWNIAIGPKVVKYKLDYVKLLKSFKDYEWIQYQMISVFEKFNLEDHNIERELFELLQKEESPLVRLAYYKLLMSIVDSKTQIFDSITLNIKSEKDLFVKKTVSYLVHQKYESLPIDIIKNWFSL